MTVEIGDRTPLGLYIDDGKAIATHSMLKTFRRCPKQAQFKYAMRLKPRLLGGPLKRGTWVHELLEDFHNGIDWRIRHKKLTYKFSQLFDEEREFYGDMPGEIATIMRSYEWHYKDDPWEVLATEFTIEAELPDGTIYRGKVDMLIRNKFGLWLVDHKTHKTLPDSTFRLVDSQSGLYLWACHQNGIPVLGFIWNYVRWKAPSVPVLLKDGSRISKSACDTDYPTFVRAIRKYNDENPNFKVTAEYKAMAKRLKDQRYKPGMPQTSSFFRRDVLEKSLEMIERVVAENFVTAQRMNSYDLSPGAPVERVIESSCRYFCSYKDLCAIDMMGGNLRPMIKQNYIVGDPNEYYQDRAGDVPEKE